MTGWRTLHQGVTRSFNARRRVFWPLWQGRSDSKLVTNRRYLDGLLTYIHLNPVAAGMVGDPAAYRWSGHREIPGRVRESQMDVDQVFVLFGDTRSRARRKYERAIKGAVGEPWLGEDPDKLDELEQVAEG